jgi:hypothetical protein
MDDNDNNDSIGKKLNLTPMSTPLDQNSKAISTIIADAHNDSVQEDFDFARSNIRQLIDDGNDAIFKLGQIAEQSQNARAYEVLGGIFATMLKANQDLLDLQKKAKDLNKPSSTEGPKSLTNNNLYLGTTSDLAKLLKDMQNDGK